MRASAACIAPTRVLLGHCLALAHSLARRQPWDASRREASPPSRARVHARTRAQAYGGIVILRKTRFAERFVAEWLKWTTAGELATDAHDPKRQHAGFVAHRHDQSILSLLLKRHRVKTFPMPAKEHDVRDIWAWDAGYCHRRFNWPLPVYRPTYYFGYIMHYKEVLAARPPSTATPTRSVAQSHRPAPPLSLR